MRYNLSSYHNGLGDCLQLTTLPEELSKLGHEVYLYEGPEVKPYRNIEIKRFVWDTNPYIIKGTCKTGWNAGDTPNVVYENKSGVFIQNWELLHGIQSQNKYPKIYLPPKKPRRNVEGLIELSSISLKYEAVFVNRLVKRIMKQFPGIQFTQITSQYQSNRIHTPLADRIEVNSLNEIWDLLCNCKVFISLNSGIHSLSAAAFKYNPTMLNYCLLPVKDYEWITQQQKFCYPGFTYLKENEMF